MTKLNAAATNTVTDWQSYTATVANSSISSTTLTYRRVGDTLELKTGGGTIPTGTPTSSSLPITFSLPSGLIADPTKATNSFVANPNVEGHVGFGIYYDGSGSFGNSGATAPARFDLSSSTTISLAFVGNAAASSNGYAAHTSLSDPFGSAGAAGRRVGFGLLVVPISTWSSNYTSGDRALEEYSSNSSSADADDFNSFVSGPNGSRGIFGTTNLTGVRIRRVRFQTPIQPNDAILLEVYDNIVAKWMPYYSNRAGSLSYVTQGSVSYGMYFTGLVSTPSTDLDVYFAQYYQPGTSTSYAATGATWTTISGGLTAWRVRKITAGAQVGYPISTASIIGRTDGSTPAAGYIGELARATSTPAAIATPQVFQTITSLTLQPGIWDMSSWAQFSTGTALTGSRTLMILSPTLNSGTPIDSETAIDTPTIPVNAVANLNITTIPYRVTISTATTYRLNVYMTFSGGTPTAFGVIRAVRVA